MSDSLWPHGLQHARLPCPSLSPWVCSDSCPLSQLCHPTISSSVVPFSCPQSFPASGSFPVSRHFASGGQSIRASASASDLPVNIHSWFPLGWTGWISLRCTLYIVIRFNITWAPTVCYILCSVLYVRKVIYSMKQLCEADSVVTSFVAENTEATTGRSRCSGAGPASLPGASPASPCQPGPR